jgi:subtilase family serine protease
MNKILIFIVVCIISLNVLGANKPDLLIWEIKITHEKPTAGIIEICVHIKNIGNIKSPASSMKLRVGGESSPPVYSVPSLIPNGYHIVKRNVTLSAGNGYIITAEVDPDHSITESNENNNIKQISFNVLPETAADLTISKMLFYPPDPVENEIIYVAAKVKNIGGKQAERSVVHWKVGGATQPGTWPVLALNPDQEQEVRLQASFPVPQAYRITVIADGTNQVKESDETNNEKFIDFIVHKRGKPDLIVKSATTTPTSPKVKQVAPLAITIKNIGDAPASNFHLCTTFLTIPSRGTYTFKKSSLRPGEEYTLTYTQVFFDLTGPNAIKVVVDCHNSVLESNEANNIYNLTVDVKK